MNTAVATPAEGAQSTEAAVLARTDLAKVDGALVEFDKVEAGLAELEGTYKGIVFEKLETTAGMKTAVAARAAVRDPRIAVEKVRQEAKAPLTALGKSLDARARQIKERLVALEEPIDAQIKAEEERKAAAKRAAEEAESNRIAAAHASINDIRKFSVDVAEGGFTSGQIADLARHVGSMVLAEAVFAEFLVNAQLAQVETASALAKQATAAKDAEARAEQEEADRRELEALRAAQADREKREAAEATERKRKQEEEDAKRRAAQQEEDRKRQERIAAEEAELERGRQELARQQNELAARQKAEREATERREREEREAAERREQEERERRELAERVIADEAAAWVEYREREAQAKARKAAEEVAAARRARLAGRPDDTEIINALRVAFHVRMENLGDIPEWIRCMDLDAMDRHCAAKAAQVQEKLAA